MTSEGLNYTADTLVKIARQKLQTIQARLDALDDERIELIQEHSSLTAIILAHEGEGNE